MLRGRRRRPFLALAAALVVTLSLSCSRLQLAGEPVHSWDELVPRPQELHERAGEPGVTLRPPPRLDPAFTDPASRELLDAALGVGAEPAGNGAATASPTAVAAGATVAGYVVGPAGPDPELGARFAAAGIDWSRDDPGAEGYVLVSGRGAVLIAGHDARGLWYGAVTLGRLLASEPVRARGELPALSIRDWPDMAYRSVYGLDLGNLDPGRIARAKELLGRFAGLKLNLVSLENHNWAMLERRAGGAERSVGKGLAELWTAAQRQHLTPRPEGWARYFPPGDYGATRPAPEASDPTLLEGIRATTALVLRGDTPQPLDIVGVSGRRFPVANVLHDLATGRNWPEEPVEVRGPGGVRYDEGRDWAVAFGAIRSPLFSRCHEGDGLPRERPRWAESANPRTTVRRTPGSRIPDGATVEVSFTYVGPDPYRPSKVRECLSDPRLLDAANPDNHLARFIAGSARGFAPEHWALTVDEFRILGEDLRCRRSGKSRARLYVDHVARQVEAIQQVRPGATVFVWSDMLDPNHNARRYGTEGALDDFAGRGLDGVVLMPWSLAQAGASVPLLAGRGFALMASCQAGGPDQGATVWAHHLRRELAGRGRRFGIQYTTWDGDQGFDEAHREPLEAVAQAAWSEGPFLTLRAPATAAARQPLTLAVKAVASRYRYAADGGGMAVPGELGAARVTLHRRVAGVAGGAFVTQTQRLSAEGDGELVVPAEGLAAPGLEYWLELESSEGKSRLPRRAPEQLLRVAIAG